MTTVGEKLTHIMKNECDYIKDEALGAALHVTRSAVSKWRSGELAFNKKEYAPKAAAFFMKNIDRPRLLSLLELSEDDSVSDEELTRYIVEFLFDGKKLIAGCTAGDEDDEDIIIDRPIENKGCFLGMQGLFDALSLFSACLKKKRLLVGEKRGQAPVCVYLSSEYCRLLLYRRADLLWDYLYEINGSRPVKLIFERWQETGRVTEILMRLMPFVLAKKLELYYIPSTERFLCYNISFLSENNCMVMTTEPAGSAGICVSVFVDSPDFIGPMSNVTGKLENMAQSMAKLIETPKDETTIVNRLFSEQGDINALFDTFNLLYAPTDGMKRLLKSCGFTYQPGRPHFERIAKQREAFGNFLQGNASMEVFLLDAIDEYIASADILIHELSFPAAARVKTDLSFLKELLEGMAGALNNYRNLQIVLARETGLRDAAWRIKDGRLILIHSIHSEEKTCFFSENWLFINHFMNLLENAYRGDRTIRGRANVMMALQNRIDRINLMQEKIKNEK